MYSKSSRRTYASAEKDVPYSQHLEEFITESRCVQTAYFNATNHAERVLFQRHEKESVKKFITYLIHLDKFLFERCTLGVSKHENEIEKCAEKIISKGGKHYSDEVQLSFVWVCYFIVKENRTGHLPVFKIYTNKNADEAVFLDFYQNEYRNWDDFLENAHLPQSLLCIPENGVYNFNGYELVLEYICFKCTTKNSIVSTITPFSQQYLPGIKRVQTHWMAVMEFLNERKKMFMDLCQKYNITSDKAVMIIYVFVVLYQTIGPYCGLNPVCAHIKMVLEEILLYRSNNCVMEVEKLRNFIEKLLKLLPVKNFQKEMQLHMIK